MKRAIFAVIIVTLALLVVTCDLLPPPTGALGAAIGSEPGFVTLSIAIGDSGDRARALSKDQAQASTGVNHYEVVFSTSAKTVRAGSTIANVGTWKITVPIADYDGSPNKAVLFAGHLDDKGNANPADDEYTLLAIGEITSITSAGTATAGATEVRINTTAVSFTLSAITSGLASKTDITTNEATAKVASSFTIKNSSSDDEYLLKVTPSIVIDTDPETYPVFKMAINESGLIGTYTFNIPNPKINYVYLGATPTLPTVTSEAVVVGANTGTALTLANKASAISGDVINVTFDITSGPTTGYSKIFIAVPVKAINDNSDNGTPISWYIRGGLDNENIDEGGDSAGGAVLLDLVDGVEIQPGGTLP